MTTTSVTSGVTSSGLTIDNGDTLAVFFSGTALSNTVASGGWETVSSGGAASNTTVNIAIVAGNVPTTSSSYSGGIENFPRFHENWSGNYFTVYGSFGLLYDSEQAKGTWANALYSPPDRHWYFDTSLQNKNPPGFPVAYSYDRGRWSTR